MVGPWAPRIRDKIIGSGKPKEVSKKHMGMQS